MLQRLGAALLLIGLVLPFAFGARPVVAGWVDWESAVGIGLPVVLAVVYAAVRLVPPLLGALEARGAAVHGAMRFILFMLMGFWVNELIEDDETRGRLGTAFSLVVVASVVWWQQRRGTKAQRVPLLVLCCVAIPAVAYYTALFPNVHIGASVVVGGLALAAAGEAAMLRGAPRVPAAG